jgi:hypothetical protein
MIMSVPIRADNTKQMMMMMFMMILMMVIVVKVNKDIIDD